MIGRRFVTCAVAIALVGGACGLGDRQAQADRIINAGKKLMASSSVIAVLSADVKVLPVDNVLVAQEPPRIAPGHLGDIAAFISPRTDKAAVALGKNSPEGAIRFVGSAMFERIAPKTVSSGAALVVAPSNLTAMYEAATGQAVPTPNAPPTTAALPLPSTTTSSTTTSTTAAPRVLRRTVQIVRDWAAFDFADIPDRDTTKHGGSFAINPVALLRLTTGVLTGSVKRHGNAYVANVSRDKAERNLSEDDRKVLDKMFTANAITRRVFPARFAFGTSGELTKAEFKLRQQLSSKDRADLTISMVFAPASSALPAVKKPSRRGTVNVSTLGQLVTTVSGA